MNVLHFLWVALTPLSFSSCFLAGFPNAATCLCQTTYAWVSSIYSKTLSWRHSEISITAEHAITKLSNLQPQKTTEAPGAGKVHIISPPYCRIQIQSLEHSVHTQSSNPYFFQKKKRKKNVLVLSAWHGGHEVVGVGHCLQSLIITVKFLHFHHYTTIQSDSASCWSQTK